MTIRFQPVLDDFWQFRKYRMRHDFWYTPVRFLSLFVAIFSLSVLLNRDIGLGFFIALIAAPIHLVLMLFKTKSEVAALSRKHPYWLEGQTVSLSQEGPIWIAAIGEAKYQWQDFVAIQDIGDHIVFRFPKWYALLIPKRFFASQHEANHFFLLALSLWQAAKSGIPRTDDCTAVWPPTPQIGA